MQKKEAPVREPQGCRCGAPCRLERQRDVSPEVAYCKRICRHRSYLAIAMVRDGKVGFLVMGEDHDERAHDDEESSDEDETPHEWHCGLL